jgi:hypothetical protein
MEKGAEDRPSYISSGSWPDTDHLKSTPPPPITIGIVAGLSQVYKAPWGGGGHICGAEWSG